MTTSVHEELIMEVIEAFDFIKVHAAMTAIDWRWQTTNGNGLEIPSIPRLKAAASCLMREAIKVSKELGDYGSIGSGGFQARYYPATDKDQEYFHLTFVLAEAYNDYD